MKFEFIIKHDNHRKSDSVFITGFTEREKLSLDLSDQKPDLCELLMFNIKEDILVIYHDDFIVLTDSCFPIVLPLRTGYDIFQSLKLLGVHEINIDNNRVYDVDKNMNAGDIIDLIEKIETVSSNDLKQIYYNIMVLSDEFELRTYQYDVDELNIPIFVRDKSGKMVWQLPDKSCANS